MGDPGISLNKFPERWFWVILFVALCLSLFLFLAASCPVRFRTPETLRLRYGALQTGTRFGPLSSSWSDFEWRKVFDWQAGDTEYRPRPVAQFFEVLMPRLYAHIRYHTGPFLWYPFDLFLTILIGVLIAALVRQWSGDLIGGVVAAAFWMVLNREPRNLRLVALWRMPLIT